MRTLVRSAIRIVLLIIVATAAGCSLDQQDAPLLVGPSGQAVTVTVTASPDALQRDGTSTSVITVAVLDVAGQPVSAQRFRMSAAPSPGVGGSLSAAEVVTGANGQASLTFTAPSVSQNVNEVTVVATSVGTDARSTSSRSVKISVWGSPVPIPGFTWAPATPAQFELVEFDASTTLLGGSPCPSCVYSWTFGAEGTGTGIRAQHRFQTQELHRVTLTVTAPGGTTASSSQMVSVGMAVAPTAAFTFSPTNPRVDETVNFNAAGSQGVNGATIVEYQWDFGNGAPTIDSVTPTATYRSARTYNVRLVVKDNRGRTSAPLIQTVTVATPALAPTAAFTFSPTNPTVGQTVFFNASGSQGANGATIVEYQWDFGNGAATVDAVKPTTTYASARTYTVVLIVKDSQGRTSPPTAQTITVAP